MSPDYTHTLSPEYWSRFRCSLFHIGTKYYTEFFIVHSFSSVLHSVVIPMGLPLYATRMCLGAIYFGGEVHLESVPS